VNTYYRCSHLCTNLSYSVDVSFYKAFKRRQISDNVFSFLDLFGTTYLLSSTSRPSALWYLSFAHYPPFQHGIRKKMICSMCEVFISFANTPLVLFIDRLTAIVSIMKDTGLRPGDGNGLNSELQAQTPPAVNTRVKVAKPALLFCSMPMPL